MNKWIKTLLFIIALGTTAALAGAIKTWSSGEVLTASDLNTVLQHIHNSMVGGHGARLVNADVASSAGIAHSKLATPALVSKAWVWASGAAGTACAASPCTINASSGVSGVTRTGAGAYTITWSAPRFDALYAITCTCGLAGSKHFCALDTQLAASVSVVCYSDTGTATDSTISLIMMDNDN